MAVQLEQSTDIPSPVVGVLSTVYTPGMSREADWDRQAHNAAEKYSPYFTFNGRQISDDEYIDGSERHAGVPRFVEIPDNMVEIYQLLGLNIDILVEGRIPWPRKAELSEIPLSAYLKRLLVSNPREIKDFRDGREAKLHRGIHTILAQDGTRYAGMTTTTARNRLTALERGGSATRLIDLINMRPDMIQHRWWFAIDSSVGSDCVVGVVGFGGPPVVGADHVGHVYSNGRSLVSGSLIGA